MVVGCRSKFSAGIILEVTDHASNLLKYLLGIGIVGRVCIVSEIYLLNSNM